MPRPPRQRDTLAKRSRFRDHRHAPTPAAMIGVITMLAEHPDISQARLARLIGLERATIGSTVGRAIEAGFVARTNARADARSHALALSPRGGRVLRTLRLAPSVRPHYYPVLSSMKERRESVPEDS